MSHILTKSAMPLAKPSQYFVDGSGRDSYINQDNGGLYRAYEPAYAPDTGTFGLNPTRKQAYSGYATIECKRQKYTSNGTGRDAYIWYVSFFKFLLKFFMINFK